MALVTKFTIKLYILIDNDVFVIAFQIIFLQGGYIILRVITKAVFFRLVQAATVISCNPPVEHKTRS